MKKLILVLVSVFVSISAFSAVIPDSLDLDKDVIPEAKACSKLIVLPYEIGVHYSSDTRCTWRDSTGYYMEIEEKFFFISLDGKVEEITKRKFWDGYLAADKDETSLLSDSWGKPMKGNFKYTYSHNYVVVMLK